ncbi:SCP2 sterol-binding domain-containing protein [Congregibacter brevis]|uniref:Ubiquinone biosynthesis accessory factor UbiJ n=1 Tax=Congregibacter brevis TaxID=3081201 RepID=A0ABZ0IGW5_9GAMM|nr:SCP2 sterol-binding domain-containing protein [Congregibacter sp. IMCC45268]
MNDIRMPTVHTAGLAAAEAAANAALRLSPHSLEALKPLAGRVLALECTRPAVTVYLHSEANGELRLQGVHDGPVATRVTGTAQDFASLAQAEDPAAALINGGIQLEGNSSTLTDMQRVFNDLDIDWEAPLVSGLGDVAGHQLAGMLSAAFHWTRQSGDNLRRQLEEFATEEARLAPPKLALEHFYEDVQQLSERSERLEQRVERLRLRLERLRPA